MPLLTVMPWQHFTLKATHSSTFLLIKVFSHVRPLFFFLNEENPESL